MFMKVLEENKGLIIFYLCVSLFMAFWVSKVEHDTNLGLGKGYGYVLTETR